MTSQQALRELGACGVTAGVFGVLAGLGGVTHGVGEVLQGAVPVDGIALDSWTAGPIAEHMGGEPGVTVLPTALAAGVATLVLSFGVVVWSITGMRRDRRGLILMLLSFGMLLAGGGVGPPVIGMLAGAVGRWGPDRQPARVRRLSPGWRRGLARGWPALFTVAAVNGLLLVVGSLVLVSTVGLHAPTVFEASFYLMVVLLGLLLLASPARDAHRNDTLPAAHRGPVPPGGSLREPSAGTVGQVGV